MNKDLIDNFVKVYTPGTELAKPDKKLLEFADKMLPSEIGYLWKEYGFGDYGDGLIKVVDPRDYMHSLYSWLGTRDFKKIPILVSAFGDIFYFRKLDEEENDVSLLNIHYRKIEVCAYSFEEFFRSFITDTKIQEDVLRKSLYDQAIAKLGILKHNEAFFFVPALVLGGREEIKYVSKGDANTHQYLLLQIGQQ
jgi:hypothetical protein